MRESSCNGSKAQVILYSLLGALVCGVLWRFRGSHGWGGEDGLLNVGFMFLCFLVILTGGNGKTTPSRIALTSIAFMCSTPAWGTFINQIKGVVSAGTHPLIPVSPFSGMIMMMLLGFGISGIFGILLGSMFSKTRWKLSHFVVLVVVFNALMYLLRATICHPILLALQPESVGAFRQSLAAAGIQEGVFKTYLVHFDDMAWAKTFVGGRNYVASLGTISMAMSTGVCLLLTRYWISDRTSARIGLMSALAFSFAITLSDLAFVLWGDTGSPALFPSKHIHAWGCWEYLTGFFAGGIMTYSVLKWGEDGVEGDGCLDFLPSKVRNISAFLVTFAVMGYNLTHPVICRFDGSDYRPIVFAAISLVFSAIVVFAAFKSRFGKLKPDNYRFCEYAFLFLLIMQSLVYFFGSGDYANFMNLPDMEHMMTLISIVLIIIFEAI